MDVIDIAPPITDELVPFAAFGPPPPTETVYGVDTARVDVPVKYPPAPPAPALPSAPPPPPAITR
jgi:hypothetical protein